MSLTKSMVNKELFTTLMLTVFVVVVVFIATGNCRNRRHENYRDPLWMQPHKLYQDYYPRANGSIYGTPRGGWDIFSGITYYPKAY